MGRAGGAGDGVGVECAPRVPRVLQPHMALPRSARLLLQPGRAPSARTRARSRTLWRPTRGEDGDGRMARRRRRALQPRSRTRVSSGSRPRIEQIFSKEYSGLVSLLSTHCSASQRNSRGGTRQSSTRSARHFTASARIARASLTGVAPTGCRSVFGHLEAESPCRVMPVSPPGVDVAGYWSRIGARLPIRRIRYSEAEDYVER